MKKIALLLCACFAVLSLWSQSQSVTKVGSLNIKKEVKPAILNIVPNSIRFEDATGNNAIDANETCKILFKVRNDGTGDGMGCKVKISSTGSTTGININDVNLPLIKVGSVIDVEIPVIAGMNTVDGIVDFSFYVDEPNGFGTDNVIMNINTKSFVSPLIRIVDFAITSNDGSSTLEKRKPFNLQFILQNVNQGLADNVKVDVVIPDGVFILNGNKMINLAKMEAGDAQSFEFELIVNQNYSNNTIPIQFNVQEKYGKYAESKTINLSLNQTLASNKISVDAIEQKQKDIKIASIGSDVDKNIPKIQIVNKNVFALIIANENYDNVSSVPFALNDGNIFSLYCKNTFGIPESNIHLLSNATLNNIKREIAWLKKITDAFTNADLIIYYAGHGIPDENTKASYLLPVDGIGSDVSTGYKLDDLYAEIGSMKAKSVTVFIDACFSGSKRDEGMIASARGVALKAKQGKPLGNMIVFSAAQGDETAMPNREQGHGMFTYFLLKKLQESRGNITMSELGNYIITNVKQQSILLNNKSQTPCVTPSSSLGDSWKNWNFIK